MNRSDIEDQNVSNPSVTDTESSVDPFPDSFSGFLFHGIWVIFAFLLCFVFATLVWCQLLYINLDEPNREEYTKNDEQYYYTKSDRVIGETAKAALLIIFYESFILLPTHFVLFPLRRNSFRYYALPAIVAPFFILASFQMDTDFEYIFYCCSTCFFINTFFWHIVVKRYRYTSDNIFTWMTGA